MASCSPERRNHQVPAAHAHERRALLTSESSGSTGYCGSLHSPWREGDCFGVAQWRKPFYCDAGNSPPWYAHFLYSTLQLERENAANSAYNPEAVTRPYEHILSALFPLCFQYAGILTVKPSLSLALPCGGASCIRRLAMLCGRQLLCAGCRACYGAGRACV